ncbi:MAG: capsular polysaccharide synthesis protein [Bacilli bacterium]|nr:capsular polysaccharide synthesis protein [Bacilli bacterium]
MKQNNFSFFRIKRKILTNNIKNLIIKQDLQRYLTYNFLYKRYKSIIDSSKYESKKYKSKKVVWFCWFQGIDNAPSLVKLCFNKIKKIFKDYEIVLITAKNYSDYINIPNYIISKWEKGIISNTHFSDIIRIELLAEHGGIWIDSTVYCTCDNVPSYIESNSMFLFKQINLNRASKDIIVSSSWFIKANKNNPIILLTRDLLHEYWREAGRLVDYFILHLFFSMASKKYEKEWEAIPNFNNVNPHILQFELGNKYNEERFKYYKKISDFHKLSYKFDFSLFQKSSNYDYIERDIYE